MATATTPAPAAAGSAGKGPVPGQFFDYSGVTRFTEQNDNNDGQVLTLQQSATVQTTNFIALAQRDIIDCLHMRITYATTYTAGGGTFTTSPYAPYNLLGNVLLSINSLYEAINLWSAEDLAIFNSYRPFRNTPTTQLGYVPPTALQWPYNPETNFMTSATFTSASTSTTVIHQLPLSLWMDEYQEIDDNANILGKVYDCVLSPFYANGTSRLLTPLLTFNPLLNSTGVDTGGVYVTGGAPTATGTATVNIQRQGFYISRNVAEVPPVFKWRNAWVSRRFTIGQQTVWTLPLKQAINNGSGGQILSFWFRMFDVGASIASQIISISNILTAQVVYGSNSIAFFDSSWKNQQRVWDQHRLVLPKGVMLFDMALNPEGKVTNQRALNTFTTDVTLIVTFISSFTPTSSFAAVVGVEYLARVKESTIAAVGG